MKTKFVFILMLLPIMFTSETFSDLTADLSIYEDSLQICNDSILIYDYPDSSFNFFTKNLNSPDWTKRYISMRVLSKLKDEKPIIDYFLNNPKLDMSCLFKIIENRNVDDSIIERWSESALIYQKISLLRVLANNPSENNIGIAKDIMFSRKTNSYLKFCAVNAISSMIEKNDELRNSIGKDFFIEAFQLDDEMVSEKCAILIGRKFPHFIEDIYGNNKTYIINLIRTVSCRKSIDDFELIKRNLSSEMNRKRFMVLYELKTYLSQFEHEVTDSLLAFETDSVCKVYLKEILSRSEK